MSQQNQTRTPQQNQTKNEAVPEGLYNQYSGLKFIQVQEGSKLRKHHLETLEALEKKVKSFNGRKAKMTQRCAIGSEQILLVKGIPVPKSIKNIIVNGVSKDKISIYIDK